MTKNQAKRLASNLKRGTCSAAVQGDRIVFTGPSGSADLVIAVSSVERVTAHWRTFCLNNGVSCGVASGRRVAWMESNGRLFVGLLRCPFKTRATTFSAGCVWMWHVSRICADGTVCPSNTHRIRCSNVNAAVI